MFSWLFFSLNVGVFLNLFFFSFIVYFKNQPDIPVSVFTNAIFRYGSPFWNPVKAVYLLAFTSSSVYCMESLCPFVLLPWFPNPSRGPELLCRFFSSAPPWLSPLHPLMPCSCGTLDWAAMKAARLWERAAWERSGESLIVRLFSCGFQAAFKVRLLPLVLAEVTF